MQRLVSIQSLWEDRLGRVRELRERDGAATDVMRFYATVLEFQHRVSQLPTNAYRCDLGFHEQLNVSLVASKLGELLQLAVESGPTLLSRRARELQGATEEQRKTLLLSTADTSKADLSGADDFFLRACLQPIAERLQVQVPAIEAADKSVCPVCGGLPQLSILRPEGDGAARWLQCSFCLREWLFRRVICPWCGELDKEKLSRFSSPDSSYVHISACDVCWKYLKAVDMTVEGRAVPLVDEVASAVLDVWAAEHGYEKVARNLMGL